MPSLTFDKKSQLDFLLNKASQYSSFISRDLEELQDAMQQEAQKKADKSDKKSKKRKGEKGSGRSGKRSKKNSGASADALKSAQEKDAATRKDGKKVIFTQPPNLTKGCVLKDYQLEGVRWLASLFENGVRWVDVVGIWIFVPWRGKLMLLFWSVISVASWPMRYVTVRVFSSRSCGGVETHGLYRWVWVKPFKSLL